jgi:hypothetical protein
MQRMLLWLLAFLLSMTGIFTLGGCAYMSDNVRLSLSVGENHELVAEAGGTVTLTADPWAAAEWAKESVDAFIGILLPEGLFPLALPTRAPPSTIPAPGGDG